MNPRRLAALLVALLWSACATPPAAAPTANAGANAKADVGELVTLDGSASTDPAGLALDYEWSFVSFPAGSAARLDNANTMRASFVPTVAGAHVLRLVARNKDKASEPSEVTITVGAPALVAKLGDAAALTGERATLEATTTAVGATLTWAWTVKDPTGAAVTDLLNATTATPSFIPTKLGAYALSVTVSDGTQTSAAVTASLLVTAAPVRPVAAFTVDTYSVRPGRPVSLDASMSFTVNRQADGQLRALTYAWSLSSTPAGATATLAPDPRPTPLATFTPDVAGLYLLKLVVSDGVADSLPLYFRMMCDPAAMGRAPVIGFKPQPAKHVVFSEVVIDASDSVAPDGDPLTFNFGLQQQPVGSVLGLTVNPTQPAIARFTPTVPGTYQVLLNLYGSSNQAHQTLTIVVEGPTTLEVVTAPTASAPAGTSAGTITLRAVSSTGTLIPNALIHWAAGDNTLSNVVGLTDAQAHVSAAVRLTRFPGATSVSAWVEGHKAASQVTLPVTATAGAPASINVAVVTAPTATTPGLVRVSTVDQLGAWATAPASASATFSLVMTSPSAGAHFASTVKNGAAGKGTLTSGGGTGTIAGTLVNGEFEIEFTDSAVEDVTLQVKLGPSASPLPFSSWTTTVDGAEAGMGAWTQPNGSIWTVVDQGAYAGLHAFQMQSPVSLATAYWTNSLTRDLSGAAAAFVKVQFRHRALAAAGTYPSGNPCQALPALYVVMQNQNNTGRAVGAVRGGYDIDSTCAQVPSFLGDGTTWRLAQFDATDAVAQGLGRLTFMADDANGYYPYNVVAPTMWALDDVQVDRLSLPGISGVTTTTVTPGAPTSVAFTQPAFAAAPVLGQCVTTPSTATQVTAEIRDASGNRVMSNLALKIKWTGTLVPAQLPIGTLVGGVGTNELTVSFVDGQARIVLTGPAQTVNVSFQDTQATGLIMGTGATAQVGQPYVCHDTGMGSQWSDGRPANTLNVDQAMLACQTYYGVGKCAADGHSAMRVITTNCAYEQRWTYAADTFADTCANSGVFTPGKVSAFYYSEGNCGCSGVAGVNAPIRVASANAATWN